MTYPGKNAQRKAMDKKNSHRSKSDNTQRKSSGRRDYIIEGNSKKQHKRTGIVERIRKR